MTKAQQEAFETYQLAIREHGKAVRENTEAEAKLKAAHEHADAMHRRENEARSVVVMARLKFEETIK